MDSEELNNESRDSEDKMFEGEDNNVIVNDHNQMQLKRKTAEVLQFLKDMQNITENDVQEIFSMIKLKKPMGKIKDSEIFMNKTMSIFQKNIDDLINQKNKFSTYCEYFRRKCQRKEKVYNDDTEEVEFIDEVITVSDDESNEPLTCLSSDLSDSSDTKVCNFSSFENSTVIDRECLHSNNNVPVPQKDDSKNMNENIEFGFNNRIIETQNPQNFVNITSYHNVPSTENRNLPLEINEVACHSCNYNVEQDNEKNVSKAPCDEILNNISLGNHWTENEKLNTNSYSDTIEENCNILLHHKNIKMKDPVNKCDQTFELDYYNTESVTAQVKENGFSEENVNKNKTWVVGHIEENFQDNIPCFELNENDSNKDLAEVPANSCMNINESPLDKSNFHLQEEPHQMSESEISLNKEIEDAINTQENQSNFSNSMAPNISTAKEPKKSLAQKEFEKLINLNNTEKQASKRYSTDTSGKCKNAKKKLAPIAEPGLESASESSSESEDFVELYSEEMRKVLSNKELILSVRESSDFEAQTSSPENSDSSDDSTAATKSPRKRIRTMSLSQKKTSNNSNDNWKKNDLLKYKLPIDKIKNDPIIITSPRQNNTSPQQQAILAIKSADDLFIKAFAPKISLTHNKGKRRNIQKIYENEKITLETRLAAEKEEKRIKRVAERRKQQEIFSRSLPNGNQLVLDFFGEADKKKISIHPVIVKKLKKHQLEGIKFMWETCFESVQRTNSTEGEGCILGHCMGLGKTLQVVALLHAVLTNNAIELERALVLCPKNVVENWIDEFNIWLEKVDTKIITYDLHNFEARKRAPVLEKWKTTGGVLVLGYELFRTMVTKKDRIFSKYLLDPGPDIVVCDEAHLLKNPDSDIRKVMEKIRTKRRIALTGTPLQNGLLEYFYMTDFTKPRLLGTIHEFKNMFVHPILNGQYINSTDADVRKMRFRAHVLNKTLKSCVQRYDHTELGPYLPAKHEYLVSISLTKFQKQLYSYYLENLGPNMEKRAILYDYTQLRITVVHPMVLFFDAVKDYANNKKISLAKEILSEYKNPKVIKRKATKSLEMPKFHREKKFLDFLKEEYKKEEIRIMNIDVKEESVTNNKKRKRGKSNIIEDEVQEEADTKPKNRNKLWWAPFIGEEYFENNSSSSNKIQLFFRVLNACEENGEKLLVFTQNLATLYTIMFLLQHNSKKWTFGIDYFTIDGDTSIKNRSAYIKSFNDELNKKARLFLISARAGGIGINLTGANRVIIFDTNFNPCIDLQSIFRVYRFGQKRTCFVYRFVAAGTIEEKIYNRNVTKMSLFLRVIDEKQVGRYYTAEDLAELYTFNPFDDSTQSKLIPPPQDDPLLKSIVENDRELVHDVYEHDSLFKNIDEEILNPDEMKEAWDDYRTQRDELNTEMN